MYKTHTMGKGGGGGGSPSRDFALAITKVQTSVMIASLARTVLAGRPDTSYFHVSKTADRAVVMCLSRVRCVVSIKSWNQSCELAKIVNRMSAVPTLTKRSGLRVSGKNSSVWLYEDSRLSLPVLSSFSFSLFCVIQVFTSEIHDCLHG